MCFESQFEFTKEIDMYTYTNFRAIHIVQLSIDEQ